LKVPATSSSGLISSNKTMAVIQCNSGGDESLVYATCNKNDWSIYFFDMATGNVIKTVPLASIDDPDVPHGELIISPDGKMLIGRIVNAIGLWDTTNAKKIRNLFDVSAGSFLGGISLSPDGKFLIAKSYTYNSPKQTFMVWDTDTWQLQRTFSGSNAGLQGYALSFSPDGNRLVTMGGKRIYDLSEWDFNTGKMLFSLTNQTRLIASAYAPSGKYFAVGGTGYGNPNWDVVSLYEANTGKLIRKLPAGLVIGTLAFSPDGTHLAAGGWSDRPGEVKIWDLSQP
jgi:WD40 repeat protein